MGMQKTIKIDVATTQDLWPYPTVNVIQQVMEEGEGKHAHGSWEKQTTKEHINHAIVHLTQWDCDTSEDHLAHAFTRLMMAVAIDKGYVKREGE